MGIEKEKNKNRESAVMTYGNVSNASTMYFDDKLISPKGHGFAAERANHLADLYTGKEAYLLGDNNAVNGPDRLVDGVYIQTKYCRSGSACIGECFDKGRFRYFNPDGSPMQIEVPSDMYDAALQAMKERIRRGEVPGVTDPADAEHIVRKGYFTYEQAKNIAKAGTVESIIYDAASGAIIAANGFGITAVLAFAVALWNGEDIENALKISAQEGLKVAGSTFISAVLAGQMSKAGLNSFLVGSTDALVNAMGPKAAAVLVNAFRSGTNIYGAAALKSASKLLRGNMITSVASFAILSSVDVVNIFRGRISGAQLFKNMTNTVASIAGGGAGWVGGAAAGAAFGSVVPGLGTAIGGFVGGLMGAFAGGTAAQKASSAVMDEFIEDDANKMVRIMEDQFKNLAGEYLINKEEANSIMDSMKGHIDGSLLKDMYADDNRKNFARNFLQPYFENIAINRSYVALPTIKAMQYGVREVLESLG